MELKPFLHEAKVALADDFTLTLAVDFQAIAYLEGMFDKGMLELLGDVLRSSTVMTQFLFALTRKHHSDLTHDVIAGIQYSEQHGQVVVAALGKLMKDVFKLSGPADAAKPKKAAKRG